jgi:hypothetical protein
VAYYTSKQEAQAHLEKAYAEALAQVTREESKARAQVDIEKRKAQSTLEEQRAEAQGIAAKRAEQVERLSTLPGYQEVFPHARARKYGIATSALIFKQVREQQAKIDKAIQGAYQAIQTWGVTAKSDVESQKKKAETELSQAFDNLDKETETLKKIQDIPSDIEEPPISTTKARSSTSIAREIAEATGLPYQDCKNSVVNFPELYDTQEKINKAIARAREVLGYPVTTHRLTPCQKADISYRLARETGLDQQYCFASVVAFPELYDTKEKVDKAIAHAKVTLTGGTRTVEPLSILEGITIDSSGNVTLPASTQLETLVPQIENIKADLEVKVKIAQALSDMQSLIGKRKAVSDRLVESAYRDYLKWKQTQKISTSQITTTIENWLTLSSEEKSKVSPIVELTGENLKNFSPELLKMLIPIGENKYAIMSVEKQIDLGIPQPINSKEWLKLSKEDKQKYYPVIEVTMDEYKELSPKAQRLCVIKYTTAQKIALGYLGIVLGPATTAFRPDVSLKDITPLEWAVSAAQGAFLAAPLLKLGTPALTALSGTAGSIFTFNTAKNWNQLSPTWRTVAVAGDVLAFIPMLGFLGRNVAVTSKAIPTIEGEIQTWKGLALFKNPIIGRSGGKWVIGTRELTLPEARLILDGYHPGDMLETKVFVNRNALIKAGMSKAQIDYLIDTLKNRNLFAGKASPYLAKEEILKATERLDPDEVLVLLKQINKYNKNIKQVDLLYGSVTIKSQLAPELRSWRGIHDWDIQTSISQEKTIAFTNDTLKALSKLPSNRQYKIDPSSPTHILKKVGNEWQGIADIHSREMIPRASEIATSKLDATGEYSYGRLVSEPAITIKYPGVGKVEIMRLSESGVRKADTLLRVRQVEGETAFRPPPRGISRPGVPKDAADLYVIFKTYEEGGILPLGTTDEWARSWARAMGYTIEEAEKLLPQITRAMEEIATKTPTNLVGYRIYPNTSIKGLPNITIHVPNSIASSVSPSLIRKVSSVRYPSMSKMPYSGVSVQLSLPKGYSPSSSKPSVSPSASVSSMASPISSSSPSVSTKPSPPSPSLSPKSPRVVTSVKKPISPSRSVSTFVPPSFQLSTSVGVPIPKVPQRLVIEKKEAHEISKRARIAGAICWRQGLFYITLYPPYGKKDIEYTKKPPAGVKIVKGPKSAYRSIVAVKGEVPREIKRDLGIMDIVIVTRPGSRQPKIYFDRDKKLKPTTHYAEATSLSGVRT